MANQTYQPTLVSAESQLHCFSGVAVDDAIGRLHRNSRGPTIALQNSWLDIWAMSTIQKLFNPPISRVSLPCVLLVLPLFNTTLSIFNEIICAITQQGGSVCVPTVSTVLHRPCRWTRRRSCALFPRAKPTAVNAHHEVSATSRGFMVAGGLWKLFFLELLVDDLGIMTATGWSNDDWNDEFLPGMMIGIVSWRVFLEDIEIEHSS